MRLLPLPSFFRKTFQFALDNGGILLMYTIVLTGVMIVGETSLVDSRVIVVTEGSEWEGIQEIKKPFFLLSLLFFLPFDLHIYRSIIEGKKLRLKDLNYFAHLFSKGWVYLFLAILKLTLIFVLFSILPYLIFVSVGGFFDIEGFSLFIGTPIFLVLSAKFALSFPAAGIGEKIKLFDSKKIIGPQWKCVAVFFAFPVIFDFLMTYLIELVKVDTILPFIKDSPTVKMGLMCCFIFLYSLSNRFLAIMGGLLYRYFMKDAGGAKPICS